MEAPETDELLLRYPITGIDFCYARVLRGQATAAPPSRSINSRRVIR